jgi:hypothetical protein
MDGSLTTATVMTGTAITNAWIQEICVMQNNLKSLNLTHGTEVSDAGLWAIARHCTGTRDGSSLLSTLAHAEPTAVGIEKLNLSGCQGVTKIGLRSLALRCAKLRELNFDHCTSVDDLALKTVGGNIQRPLWATRESPAIARRLLGAGKPELHGLQAHYGSRRVGRGQVLQELDLPQPLRVRSHR